MIEDTATVEQLCHEWLGLVARVPPAAGQHDDRAAGQRQAGERSGSFDARYSSNRSGVATSARSVRSPFSKSTIAEKKSPTTPESTNTISGTAASCAEAGTRVSTATQPAAAMPAAATAP